MISLTNLAAEKIKKNITARAVNASCIKIGRLTESKVVL